MFIKHLKINGFRCYESVDLKFENRINVFFGANGSGKTSILEAIYFLSTGKSFRSKKNKVLVNNEQDQLVLFTQFSENKPINTISTETLQSLGISFIKSSAQKKIKLNQQTILHQSDVAHLLPVVSIDPESYLFIDKGPQFRRSFLDWLVFHVKPEYLNIWAQTMRCHKQLNALYKSRNNQMITEWEEQYVNYGHQLNQFRLDVFHLLSQKVKNKIVHFLPELSDIDITFFQGWSKEINLREQLNKDRDKNFNYGNLFSGVHKMDIKCKYNQALAQDALSRGQKKIISIIFNLSFIEILTESTGLNPVVCLDDLDAELDQQKTHLLCDFINQSKNQIFLTTVDVNKITSLLKNVSMFHVEHGYVNPHSK